MEVLADHLLALAVSDGANAVATAATKARHRKIVREIMVKEREDDERGVAAAEV